MNLNAEYDSQMALKCCWKTSGRDPSEFQPTFHCCPAQPYAKEFREKLQIKWKNVKVQNKIKCEGADN